jgi:hypothetical protein
MKTRTKALLTTVLITEAIGAGGSAFAAISMNTVLNLENFSHFRQLRVNRDTVGALFGLQFEL